MMMFKYILVAALISFAIQIIKWFLEIYTIGEVKSLDKFPLPAAPPHLEPFYLECHKPHSSDDSSSPPTTTTTTPQVCSIATLVPCNVNEPSPCDLQCSPSSSSSSSAGKCNSDNDKAAVVIKRLVCAPVAKDVLFEDGTLIPKTEPGRGYCLPQLQAASLAVIAGKDVPCTYRNGCRWLVTDNRGNKLTVNEAAAADNNIRLQRVCVFPQVYVPDTDGDCTFQVACGGVDRGQLNDFDFIEQAHCTCRPEFYTMKKIHCIRRNVFLYPHEWLPYLPQEAVDVQYRGALTEYMYNDDGGDRSGMVASAADVLLVNPCAIDFMTGQTLGAGRNLLTKIGGVYQCAPDALEPNFFVCQMEDDYLGGNGGKYANCVFYCPITLFGRIMAWDRTETNREQQGEKRVTQRNLNPIYGILVNYMELCRVLPGFVLRYLEQRYNVTAQVPFQPDIPRNVGLSAIQVVFYFPPTGGGGGGTVMTEIRKMATPVQEALRDVTPTGLTGIPKDWLVGTSCYFSYDINSQYEYVVNYALLVESRRLFLPHTPSFGFQAVGLKDPDDLVRMFNGRVAANPVVAGGFINVYSSLFTGMVLTNMENTRTAPFSGANRYMTDRYRRFVTTAGKYAAWENPTPARSNVWVIEADYRKPSRVCHDCHHITWKDCYFTTNCFGLETTRENGLIPYPNMMRHKKFTYDSIIYDRRT